MAFSAKVILERHANADRERLIVSVVLAPGRAYADEADGLRPDIGAGADIEYLNSDEELAPADGTKTRLAVGRARDATLVRGQRESIAV